MISVENLTKRFGPKVAVDDISFEVGKGEVLGFLGPNGAGKSTTMRMVTGYFEPTSGSISIGDISMLDDPIAAKTKIGYLPENAPLYGDMTVAGFLGFAADLRGLRGSAKRSSVDQALETCFLEPVRRQSVDTLSKGYRHRTCLAQSIIHDPEVLILDEPTDGLDPNQKHEVRNLIRRMGESRTIIFSTHILEEVEAACTRAIVVDRGRIVADGTPAELKARDKNAGSLEVVIEGMAATGIKSELESLNGSSAVIGDTDSDQAFSGRVIPAPKTDPRSLAGEISSMCSSKNLTLTELHAYQGRLDDVFRDITETD